MTLEDEKRLAVFMDAWRGALDTSDGVVTREWQRFPKVVCAACDMDGFVAVRIYLGTLEPKNEFRCYSCGTVIIGHLNDEQMMPLRYAAQLKKARGELPKYAD